MPRIGKHAPRWMVALAWLLTTGCSGSVSLVPTFWGHGSTPAPPESGPPPNHAAGPIPPGRPAAGAPGPAPNGGPHPLAPTEAHAERQAEWAQRLAVSEDERKALAARVPLLETALEEKDKALAQTTKEIQGTRDEVARARAEVQRSKEEMAEIRNRLRNTEKDSLTTLQSIVSMLEQMAERDKPAEGKGTPATMEPARH